MVKNTDMCYCPKAIKYMHDQLYKMTNNEDLRQIIDDTFKITTCPNLSISGTYTDLAFITNKYNMKKTNKLMKELKDLKEKHKEEIDKLNAKMKSMEEEHKQEIDILNAKIDALINMNSGKN